MRAESVDRVPRSLVSDGSLSKHLFVMDKWCATHILASRWPPFKYSAIRTQSPPFSGNDRYNGTSFAKYGRLRAENNYVRQTDRLTQRKFIHRHHQSWAQDKQLNGVFLPDIFFYKTRLSKRWIPSRFTDCFCIRSGNGRNMKAGRLIVQFHSLKSEQKLR